MDIIMWVLVVVAAITILWYAFGNSPTFEQSLIIFLFGVSYNFGKSYFRFKENTILSFSRVSNNISHIKRDVNEIKDDTSDIRKEIIDMRKDITEIKGALKNK